MNLVNFSSKKSIDFSLSKDLLENDALLTPRLQSNFGQIDAFETSDIECFETQKTYLRESILIQKCSGEKILEATLRIVKQNLPPAFVQDLRTTNTPFGELIKKYKISVSIINRNSLIIKEFSTGKTRMGRSHTIIHSNSKKIICHVREILTHEENLIKAKKRYSQHKQ